MPNSQLNTLTTEVDVGIQNIIPTNVGAGLSVNTQFSDSIEYLRSTKVGLLDSFLFESISFDNVHPIYSWYSKARQVIEELTTTEEFISVLPNDVYELIEPIPVTFEKIDEDEWVARFESANIGISGSDPEDAMEALAHDIVDAMGYFTKEESNLIPTLKDNLKVLRSYIKVRE